MKSIIVSLLTVGTTFAGYTAYQSNPNQFAPLVSRIQTILPTYQAPSPGYSVPRVQTVQTAAPQANTVQTTAQTNSGPTYVELLNPHVQATFAPLEVDRGKLSEEPILRLREWFLREREREEASEAIGMVDRLLVVMHEREHFRERMESPAGSFSDEFFKERIRQEWLNRSKELSASFDRDWATFAAHEARFRERYVEYHRGHEYLEVIRGDEFRPRYGEHLGSGYVFARVNEWEHRYPIEEHRNPLEVHHNPLEEHHNPLDEHHNPLETNHNPLEANHNPLEEHHNPLERGPYHNPLETNSRPEIGSTNHPTSTTTGLDHRPTGSTGTTVQNHPQNHPTTVSHPVVRPATVIAPVTAAGGA
ncbi:MAG TPA: hypothetical protein VGM54_07070 [Chthoniobacter sp.]|jgi:hypothetical protein